MLDLVGVMRYLFVCTYDLRIGKVPGPVGTTKEALPLAALNSVAFFVRVKYPRSIGYKVMVMALASISS